MMAVYELNLDGLVGPTHHYAGLSFGNVASTSNAFSTANPRAAALQGIEKMRFLHKLGLKQAVLPPHPRPNLSLLHQLGFTGKPAEAVTKAYHAAPHLLSACYSASSMWAANSATVSASLDSADGLVHFTPANLISNFHRHQEAYFSSQLLKKIFNHQNYFAHHPALPACQAFSDEGAANHSRLCLQHNKPGINFFVFGKYGLQAPPDFIAPIKFPARQTLEASEAIARTHKLKPEKTIFALQNPAVIDQGVFHNDVIAVANESVLLIHEQALFQQHEIVQSLQKQADFALQIIEVKTTECSVNEAVTSYLFNSQLITLPNGCMTLIAPLECKQNERIASYIAHLIADANNPITQVHYLDLKQSMRNGGGPACLRLRIPLTDNQLRAMHQGILINDELIDKLTAWVNHHYRTELTLNDLADPALIDESFNALDALTKLLNLGSIYPFQLEQN